MYFNRTPSIIQKLFPKLVWHKNNSTNKIYLTFDDGPNKEATPQVLSILNERNIKATFFCLGENILKNEKIVRALLSDGHQIANHSYGHENGWKTERKAYLSSVTKCQQLLDKYTGENKKYFRPPYGRLKPNQLKSLENEYEIVMWTVMSGDFDRRVNAETCLNKLTKLTKPGDIILFHDNEKSIEKLKAILPEYLDYCISRGYEFGLV